MSSEKSLVNRILNYLNQRHQCKAVKNHGSIYSENGRPDIDVCDQGIHGVLEIKKPGEKATPIQLKRIRDYAKAGSLAYIVDNFERVKELYPPNE